MPEVVGVQLVKGGGVFYYQPLEKRLQTGTICVVEAEHGLHAGRVVHPLLEVPEKGLNGPLPKILRLATPRDCEQLKQNERKEREAYRLCRKKVKEKNLAMKLVDVTYPLDGRKAVFFFTAENRIDFRELVKELAQALKIKIEMRQIGVRDETRRLGGVGCCGRSLCCCSFLRDFVSVSIRMAKDQNLSLNPTKVSGLCGRLMCCLAYEYEGPSKDKKKKREGDAAGASGHCAESPSGQLEKAEKADKPGQGSNRWDPRPVGTQRPNQGQRPQAATPFGQSGREGGTEKRWNQGPRQDAANAFPQRRPQPTAEQAKLNSQVKASGIIAPQTPERAGNEPGAQSPQVQRGSNPNSQGLPPRKDGSGPIHNSDPRAEEMASAAQGPPSPRKDGLGPLHDSNGAPGPSARKDGHRRRRHRHRKFRGPKNPNPVGGGPASPVSSGGDAKKGSNP